MLNLNFLSFRSVVCLAFALSLATTVSVQASEWKPKTVTVLSPHSIGGGQDRLTRALVKVWAKHLGSKMKVYPKPGASGRIGFDLFLTKPQDGTFVISTNIATSGTMYIQQKPDWSWQDSFHMMGTFGIDVGAIFVLKDSPLKSMKDVIAMGKNKKSIVALASWATVENIQIQQLMAQTGAKFTIIPIGGGGDLVTAVLGKHVRVGFGKVSNIRKAGDRVRILAVSLKPNPIPELTGNAPTVDGVLGTNTVPVASYRSILVPKSLKTKHPNRLKKLKTSFEAAKDDPAYIKAAKKVGISPKLIVDMGHDELNGVLKSYWASFEKHGAVLKTKIKMNKVKSKIVKVHKKGKKITFIDKDGKKKKIKVHRRRTKIYFGGKRVKGKKALKMLKKGMECEIGYIKVPVLAKRLKCS